MDAPTMVQVSGPDWQAIKIVKVYLACTSYIKKVVSKSGLLTLANACLFHCEILRPKWQVIVVV
jgi:hypothetical protein